MNNIFFKTSFDADEQGHFGEFGGRYVPELLMPALKDLEQAYLEARADPHFLNELMGLYHNFSGRPTPLVFAENFSKHFAGAKIYFKNEGQNLTGAHKINHCLGQALLARRMGKKRLIAETGAGQHGLATATVAAKMGFDCTVYMGKVDYDRQRPNVFWMEQLGAQVVPVEYGAQTLKDAVTAAIQDWITSPEESYYLLGSALGPHPYPSLVRDFQCIVGLEVRQQMLAYEGRELPDSVVACVGGGSNAIGIFNTFLDEPEVALIGVEAGGRGIGSPGEHAARLASSPRVGVVEGYKSFFLQNEEGQISSTHSISAGLDYMGIGPEHALLYQRKRVRYASASDEEVIAAFSLLARTEGLLPALESAHAVAHAIVMAPTLPRDHSMVVNISGRADKDLFILGDRLGGDEWKNFLKGKTVS